MEIMIGYFDPSFENNETSDFKAWSVWGQRAFKRYCIKRFTRRCELEEAFEAMIEFEKSLPRCRDYLVYGKAVFSRPVKSTGQSQKNINIH